MNKITIIYISNKLIISKQIDSKIFNIFQFFENNTIPGLNKIKVIFNYKNEYFQWTNFYLFNGAQA